MVVLTKLIPVYCSNLSSLGEAVVLAPGDELHCLVWVVKET